MQGVKSQKLGKYFGSKTKIFNNFFEVYGLCQIKQQIEITYNFNKFYAF
jgi:hypothetical protein